MFPVVLSLLAFISTIERLLSRSVRGPGGSLAPGVAVDHRTTALKKHSYETYKLQFDVLGSPPAPGVEGDHRMTVLGKHSQETYLPQIEPVLSQLCVPYR